MIIRLATKADFPALWPILRDVFRAGTTYAVDPAISRDAAYDYWMQQPAATYVALADDAVVGTYYLRTNQPGGGAHICNCGYIVAPAARGQGLAAQMCLHSQDQARAMGYLAMQFNFVLASNAGALRLWQRLGFATIGTIPDAFRHPEQGFVAAHVMHKRLT
ncbi:GNAT family N-acetyltransferase [Yoonia vestfoldensis]|uniref:Acetyltransferase (GNAT) family protein n=1 Tax=Yoonia vestfoldensis TaxID=245188 RepID=A0A1Y0EA87_9RHOB|nr:GNAT family N-acetyltransferase [Yoonia vestfoldensis]ARU00319.1 acetyltransferase (GNAT) family protein [Yoonia vestfoldensis]